MRENLLAPEPTLLPADPAAALLAAGTDVRQVVKQHPESALAWAQLAAAGRNTGVDAITVYAYARVGYHRGLDVLRKNGWRGAGPIPYSHEPNRGVLRALYELLLAAQTLGESSETVRLTDFINDSDPLALKLLAGEAERG